LAVAGRHGGSVGAWLGVALTDFHVLPHGYLIVFAIAAVYGVLGYCNATSATRHNPRVCFILTAIAQIILVVAVMTSLTLGVLTFPSFHAVSAVLYAWAFWPIRWLRPLALLCNGAMMAATPVGWGHYLVDLLAGIVVAAAAIYAARLIVRRFVDAKISREAPVPYREDSRDAPGRAIEPVGCGSALAGAAAGAGPASPGGFGGSGSTPCISG
jgi:hypothetical protein